jgi:phosphatidylserine/phosphatidylglycerophosphate/cardiolipin synthase-like enzyme
MNKTKIIVSILLLLFILSFLWGQLRPLPDGIYTESNTFFVKDSNIDFLYDLTTKTDTGRTSEQEIFDNVFDIIDSAEEFILIDMFLFSTQKNLTGLIDISTNLKDKLIEKKRTTDIPIYFITDEFNTAYKSTTSPLIKELEDAGVQVIYTNLDKIRDANPIFNSVWRLVVKPFGLPEYTGGAIPNFLGEGKISLRSVLKLLNFKANHRKVIISEKESLITSGNPHTGSSMHSNVGVRVTSSDLVAAMLNSEIAVAKFSGTTINISYDQVPSTTGNIQIKYITEKHIEEEIIEEIRSANPGDNIKIGMFYISMRTIVKELKNAKKRGVSVTLVLDANKDAFGKEKNGIPNRQVAYELKKVGVEIYWYETTGEQFHTKIFIKETEDTTTVIVGSGNYTRRNIGNFNLEADLEIVAPNDSNFATEIRSYWDQVINNSLEYEAFEDTSKLKYLLYRFQEWSGISTF